MQMSSVAVAMDGEAAVTHTDLGWSFVNRGLGLFVTGFVTGFIPILHYIPGAVAEDVGPAFLKNVTLWWGCGLGMTAIGLSYLAAARQGASPTPSGHERIAPTLCAYGLIAELVTAGVGYVACNYFWPNFYFEPVQAGKNLWLVLQGLSILVFVVGLFYAVAGVRRASSALR
jgi:hypothetical protein